MSRVSATGGETRKQPYPPFSHHPLRYLRWHLRENWSNEWSLGPMAFDVEWVPKARYYVFGLIWSRPKPEDL